MAFEINHLLAPLRSVNLRSGNARNTTAINQSEFDKDGASKNRSNKRGINALGVNQKGLTNSLLNKINSSAEHFHPSAFDAALFDSAMDDSDAIAKNIEQAIQSAKQYSLAYQLMVAIAQQNQSNETLNSQPAGGETQIYIEEQFSFSLSFEMSIEFSDGSNFNIDLQVELSQTSSIEFVSNGENGSSQLSMSFEQSSSFSLSMTSRSGKAPQSADPLILNLNDSDYSFSASQYITFDLNADSQTDLIHNLNPGNAFLALDKNQNGLIDNGRELFGDAEGAKDGFVNLAQYDDNHDNQIDANDKIFSQLMLLSFDHQGQQKLEDLASQNIQQFNLNAQSMNSRYLAHEYLIAESSFEREDGSKGKLGDFLMSLG